MTFARSRKCRTIATVVLSSIPLLVHGQAEPSSQTGAAITLVHSQAQLKPASLVETPERNALRLLQENFREFERVGVSHSSRPERFVLEFHTSSKITALSASGDFRVTGGDCAEGRQYLRGQACAVEVTFLPIHPGRRTGQLAVGHTASATPFLTPLGGTAEGPTVSFNPSVIETLPGTDFGTTGGGLISGPGQLAIDGGDNLYLADPGHHLIRKMDSSGVISTLLGGGTISLLTSSAFGPQVKLNTPTGVAVDYTGTLYFSDNGDKLIGTYYLDNIAVRRIGGGSGANANSCTTSSPCVSPGSLVIGPPTTLAVDPAGNLYSALTYGGSLPGSSLAEFSVETSSDFYNLDTTAYNYYTTSNALTVDPFGYGNLYYTYLDPGGSILSPTPLCYILGQNYAYSHVTSGPRFWTVAGSGKCGYSGDGVKAGSAEISKAIGQFAWDAAGNFYFTDTGNNRIRRIDGVTGVVRTLAGSGPTGTSGDGGPSTDAHLASPLGLAVDSTGRVYFTVLAPSSSKYDVRVIGTVGAASLGTVTLGSHSAAKTVLVSNVGNDVLDFTRFAFTAGNEGDFAVDPNTTTCLVASPLPSGRSCNIGFIFTPKAAGSRSAVLTISDDTYDGSNTINLTGTGAKAAAISKVESAPGGPIERAPESTPEQ